jgi:hypothetical protein
MPLPKINTPTFELVLPSTAKKIKYRPFLVREEKILVMAMESDDMKQITSAINFDASDTTRSEVSQSLDMITSCIDMIYNEEESWSSSDSTKKELSEFIEQLNTKQFKDVEKFFATMPKLSHTVKVKNPKTGVENKVVLEGLASFFS